MVEMLWVVHSRFTHARQCDSRDCKNCWVWILDKSDAQVLNWWVKSLSRTSRSCFHCHHFDQATGSHRSFRSLKTGLKSICHNGSMGRMCLLTEMTSERDIETGDWRRQLQPGQKATAFEVSSRTKSQAQECHRFLPNFGLWVPEPRQHATYGIQH